MNHEPLYYIAIAIVLVLFVGWLLFNARSIKNKITFYKSELSVLQAGNIELQKMAKVGCWYRDLRNNKLYWCRYTHEIFGITYSKKGLSIDEFYQAIHPDDRELVKNVTSRTLDFGEEYDVEYRVVRPDGKIVHCHNKARLYFDTKGQPFKMFGTCQDITLEKNTFDKKVHNAKMVSLGELAAGVAHEVNNPLTILLGHLKLMDRAIEKGDFSKIKNYLEKQEIAVNRISKIVNSFSTFSRSENGTNVLFDVQKSIEDTVDLVEEVYCKEDIKIYFNFDENAEYYTSGCVGEFQQVLLNLLSNSKDAMENLNEGKIIIIELSKENDNLKVLFSDNGHGIKAEHRSKVFNSFYTTKLPGKGTGLGLHLSQNIMIGMDGKIEVFDTNETGTTFALTLPSYDKKVEKLGSDEKKNSILVIDDEVELNNFI